MLYGLCVKGGEVGRQAVRSAGAGPLVAGARAAFADHADIQTYAHVVLSKIAPELLCENDGVVLKTRNLVSNSHKNEEFCIKNCIQNDDFCREPAAEEAAALEHAKRIVSLESEIGKVQEQAGVLRDRGECTSQAISPLSAAAAVGPQFGG